MELAQQSEMANWVVALKCGLEVEQELTTTQASQKHGKKEFGDSNRLENDVEPGLYPNSPTMTIRGCVWT